MLIDYHAAARKGRGQIIGTNKEIFSYCSMEEQVISNICRMILFMLNMCISPYKYMNVNILDFERTDLNQITVIASKKVTRMK